MGFLLRPVKVAAVVLRRPQHFCQAFGGFQKLRPDRGPLDGFGGGVQLTTENTQRSRALTPSCHSPSDARTEKREPHLLHVASYSAPTVELHVGGLGLESSVNT